jgi:hypothetical protein
MRVAATLLIIGSTASAGAEPHRVHAEVDPLPFALGGYGGQIGYRSPTLPRWRVAAASFSLDVPEPIAELGGNDGFSVRVRPSFAVYLLYYRSGTRGLALGGSVRFLRPSYTRDDTPGERADVGELSLEAIVGYKWHPFAAGLFIQPWLGIARTLIETGDEPVVGGQRYEPTFLSLFATANIGWELEL